MVHKQGAHNPIQKGERRQRIKDKQDNVGNDKNQPEYKNFEGKIIE